MTPSNNLAAVVMAAGLGTRMRSAVPKHLHPLLGRRMVDWVLAAAREAGADPLVVVASPDTADAFEGVEVAVQEQPLGTGDAVASARAALEGFDGDVLVLDAATPLLTARTCGDSPPSTRAQAPPRRSSRSSPTRPRRTAGSSAATTDASRRSSRPATPRRSELAIGEVNSSIYVFRADPLWPALERLEPHNAQGELYLTDTVAPPRRRRTASRRRGAARTTARAAGINTRAELAVAAAVLRDRINEAHMLAGVTIVDPATTWIEPGVELEPDVDHPPVHGPARPTAVAAGAEIGPHAVAIDAVIGTVRSWAVLLPSPRNRPRAGSKAGTFVEIKNSRIGAADEGAAPLVHRRRRDRRGHEHRGGQHHRELPARARPAEGPDHDRQNVRTGVHNAFVAPVEIGDDAWIAAGSVITKDVPPGSLAGFPPRQERRKDGSTKRGKRRDD